MRFKTIYAGETIILLSGCDVIMKDNMLTRRMNKLFGGLNMSWLNVILFAVGTAVLTTVFLCVPVFKNTSFHRVGEFYEAWIFFAIIVMSNCKKPLESALKTFVFFLVSQPLIYLFQVPFSSMGWGILGYYRTWFIITLFTFPAAFIGWFIKKKNWLSVLILSPMIVSLGMVAYGTAEQTIDNFPRMLLASLFCLFQIIVYILVFFPKKSQKIVGVVLVIITAVIMIFDSSKLDMTVEDSLPDYPKLSAEATVSVEDPEIADVVFKDPQEAELRISAHKYGKTDIIITDGDKELRYTIEIFKDKGVNRARISPAGTN